MRSEIEVALRDDKLPEKEARALLQSNLEEIDKLTLLSDSLLKLAREQKIGPISTNEVSLEEIAKNAIKGLSTKAKAKKLSFVNELNNIKVRGDQSMLTEVITILLDNAIKYSPEGKSIDIKISESREHARVIITDHGIGISEVDLPHIFDRFYRADISRSGTDGHGLGLSIAKQIAELHLGNIEITSKQDQGTIAALVLPKI